MASEHPTYQISVDQIPRVSQDLLANQLQTIAKNLNVTTESLDFISFFKEPFPSIKVLPGPEPQLRLIGAFRRLRQKVPQRDEVYYPYFGLFLVDLSKQKLDVVNLLWKKDQNETKVRDVAVHPNNRIVTIVFDNRIENYLIEKQKDQLSNQYTIRFTDKFLFADPMLMNNVIYHPSGQFLVGINCYYDSNRIIQMIKPFKFELASKNLVFGLDLIGKCVDPQYFYYLAKWNIVIDKNAEWKAMIAGGQHRVCLLDLKTMQYEVVPFDQSSDYSIPKFPEDNQIKILANVSNEIAQSCGYINSTNSGSFLVYEAAAKLAHRIEKTKNNYSSNGVFIFMPNDQSSKYYQRIKCVDIDHINSMACMQSISNKIYIFKIDRNQNLLFPLKNINYRNNSIRNLTQQQYLNLNYQNLEDIFYSETTSQICSISELKVVCFKISTNCTATTELSPLASCDSACKKLNQKSYWNPMKMSCQNCSNCQCSDPRHSYNPYYGGCALDCSKISLAAPNSEYSSNKKCVCLKPYSWDQSLQMCRFDCSSLPYADRTANPATLDPNQCKCLQNFKFLRKLDSFDTAGYCQLICPNGKFADLHQAEFICNCSSNQKWNSTSRKCISPNSTHPPQTSTHPPQTSTSPLIWPIVLLVLLGILLLFIVGFLVWKKMKAKKKQQDVEQVPASSDRQQRLGRSSQQKKSEEQLKDVKLCTVCNIRESDANCVGPCGHYYHFYCIKQRFDQNDNECPECKQVFPNGVGDMKIVEKEDDNFTISDNP